MTKKETIKMFTLFSGYESQLMGLINAVKNSKKSFGVELVGWSDIDPSVQLVHNLVFPEYADRCYPDVTTIDWKKIPFFDILFYSSPCQSASRSGRREGFEKDSGTKSALVWAVESAIAHKRPKWLILENVEGYLDPKNEQTLIKWARTLASYGYVSYFKVLCSADYGVPQNRNRIFLISMRIDKEEDSNFQWPEGKKLTKKPEDLLEDSVSDEYYLSVEMVNAYIDLLRNAKDGYQCSVGNSQGYPTKYVSSQFYRKISATVTPIPRNGAISTLQTGCGSTSIVAFANCRQERLSCVVEVWEGEKGIKPIPLTDEKPCRQLVKARRESAGRERILSIVDNIKDGQYLRIRRLTPKECLRFMGVEDMYIDRMLQPYKALAKEGYTEEQITQLMTIGGKYRKVSDYALYGRAGNSIVVNVLTAIFTSIIKQYPNSFGEYCGLSPEEVKAAKKREYAQRYYEKNKEELRRKSRESKRAKRSDKTEAVIEKMLSLEGYANEDRKARRKGPKATQEFFTPFELVKDMCAKVSEEDWKNPKKTFIEPCLGNGQFVLYIIWKRLQSGISLKDTLNTLYGIELLEDNVKETKERIVRLLDTLHVKYDKEEVFEILDRNLVCADFLKWNCEEWRPYTEEELIEIAKVKKQKALQSQII